MASQSCWGIFGVFLSACWRWWWMKLRGFWSQRNRSHISAAQHTRAAGRRLTARTPVVTYGKSDSFTALCCRGYSGLARKEETSSSRLLRLLAKATKLSFLSSLSGCAHQMSHVLTKQKKQNPKKHVFSYKHMEEVVLLWSKVLESVELVLLCRSTSLLWAEREEVK